MHCPHTKQCTAVDKSLRHQDIFAEKNLECQELNPWPLGAKREHYPLSYAATQPRQFLYNVEFHDYWLTIVSRIVILINCVNYENRDQ